MNKILMVQSKECKILDIFPPNLEDLLLATTKLDNEIACTFFSLELNKVSLARNIDIQQLPQLFNEINPHKLKSPSLIKVRIIGGNESHESKEYLHQLISVLNTIDNGSNIINIISNDTCSKLHPNSFTLNCYHGGVRELEGMSTNS